MNAIALKALRYSGWGIGCALAVTAFVWVCGLMIPSRHEAAASLRVEAAPEAVLAVLSSVEGYPRWRKDVAEVETLDGGASATRRWRETGPDGRVTDHEAGTPSGSSGGPLPAGRVSALPRLGGSEKWVERSVTDDGRVRVERTFLIVAEGETGTRVALTGKTDLEDPLARFRARFVSGYAEDLNALLEDLRKRLGE
jgi:hypothetical protein